METRRTNIGTNIQLLIIWIVLYQASGNKSYIIIGVGDTMMPVQIRWLNSAIACVLIVLIGVSLMQVYCCEDKRYVKLKSMNAAEAEKELLAAKREDVKKIGVVELDWLLSFQDTSCKFEKMEGGYLGPPWNTACDKFTLFNFGMLAYLHAKKGERIESCKHEIRSLLAEVATNVGEAKMKIIEKFYHHLTGPAGSIAGSPKLSKSTLKERVKHYVRSISKTSEVDKRPEDEKPEEEKNRELYDSCTLLVNELSSRNIVKPALYFYEKVKIEFHEVSLGEACEAYKKFVDIFVGPKKGSKPLLYYLYFAPK